jgi:hypothetical protein
VTRVLEQAGPPVSDALAGSCAHPWQPIVLTELTRGEGADLILHMATHPSPPTCCARRGSTRSRATSEQTAGLRREDL